jgi:energy-coupling factor transporter ATP-binding protein EcfA2
MSSSSSSNLSSVRYTEEQRNIIQSPLEKGETRLVAARAGCGKTTTLEGLSAANPDKLFLYLAFNKSAALDATKHFPQNCDAKTTHALSLQRGALRNRIRRRRRIGTALRQMSALRCHLRV